MDLRTAFRSLLKSRGMTTAAVLSLALGIGANTTIFSVVDAVLLRPLPYPSPHELFAFRSNQSPPDLRDLREQSRLTQRVSGYASYPLDLVAPGGEPEQLPGALIVGPLFEALGVRPQEGRVLVAADDSAGAQPVAVISTELRRRLNVGVGDSLLLSGRSFAVVGVMPPGFQLPEGASQVWVPLATGYPEASLARGAHFITGLARIGASREQAQAELDAIQKRLAKLYPAEDLDQSFRVVPLQEKISREVRGTLTLLFLAVGLLLLVACANFAGLLLARGAARRHELAVRTALGASRGQIVGQLLTESALLSLLGGAAAALIAAWSLPLLLALDPKAIPQVAQVSIDARVLAVTFGAAIFTGLVFGLLPALQISRVDLLSTLKEAAPNLGGRARMRSALVVAEIALAVVLLAGAGLVLRSLYKLRQTPLGFDPSGTLTLRVDLPGARYAKVETQTQFFDRLLSDVQALPGVQAAGIVSELPLTATRLTHNTFIEGMPPVPEGAEPEIGAHVASAGYFAAMRIPLLEGRLTDDRDRAGGPQVVLVNAALARKYFGSSSAVGRRLRFSRETPARWMTIVGVVGDAREEVQSQAEPAVYVPYAQNSSPWHRWETLVVRGDASLANAMKKAVWSADSQLPVTQAKPMEEVLAQSLSQVRLTWTLLSLFAALALLLGAVGVHGLVAYSSAQRTHEFGVRLVLGATRGRVMAMVLREGLRLSLIGLCLGTAAAIALGRWLASFLFGVQPTDPATYAGIALVIAGASLLASWLPAWRASRIEPMSALRQE